VCRFSTALRVTVGLASAPTCSCMHATVLYTDHEPPGDMRVRTSASYMSIMSPGSKLYELMTQSSLDTSHIQPLTIDHSAQRAVATSCLCPAETRTQLNLGSISCQSTRMVLRHWQDFRFRRRSKHLQSPEVLDNYRRRLTARRLRSMHVA
jgi:hypothetical protein